MKGEKNGRLRKLREQINLISASELKSDLIYSLVQTSVWLSFSGAGIYQSLIKTNYASISLIGLGIIGSLTNTHNIIATAKELKKIKKNNEVE